MFDYRVLTELLCCVVNIIFLGLAFDVNFRPVNTSFRSADILSTMIVFVLVEQDINSKCTNNLLCAILSWIYYSSLVGLYITTASGLLLDRATYQLVILLAATVIGMTLAVGLIDANLYAFTSYHTSIIPFTLNIVLQCCLQLIIVLAVVLRYKRKKEFRVIHIMAITRSCLLTVGIISYLSINYTASLIGCILVVIGNTLSLIAGGIVNGHSASGWDSLRLSNLSGANADRQAIDTLTPRTKDIPKAPPSSDDSDDQERRKPYRPLTYCSPYHRSK